MIPLLGRLRRTAGLLVRRAASWPAWRRDLKKSTFTPLTEVPQGPLAEYLTAPPLSLLEPLAERIRALARLSLEHRFDLLGSGWVRIEHGLSCRGLEGRRFPAQPPVAADQAGRWLKGRVNRANLAEARSIWSLVQGPYQPLDWQLDYRSGFRWSERAWHGHIRFGHLEGVEVKVPWELARMEHLVQLPLAAMLSLAGRSEPDRPEVYFREFRNQILDFMAVNPPGFGVNWQCPMEAAIRIGNWLVTYDLFRAAGMGLPPQEELLLKRSVLDHGRHIAAHLEWDPGNRSNHYLANLTGLLLAAAYLPSTPETDGWLAFAVRGLTAEVGYQFRPDGSGHENSTAYHRLSGEMVVLATAYVLALPPEKARAWQEAEPMEPPRGMSPILDRPGSYLLPGSERVSPFSPDYLDRLESMAEFSLHLTKPNGRPIQVGDNDSGRFLKLQPELNLLTVGRARAVYANLEGFHDLPDGEDYWDEEDPDHRPLVAAVNGFFNRADLAVLTGPGRLEEHLIRNLTGNLALESNRAPGGSTPAGEVRIETKAGLDGLGRPEVELEIPVPGGGLNQGLELLAYPDFGLYLRRSKRLFLALRCGPRGQEGIVGHAHLDQLALELNLDGRDLIVDPGSYLYTSLPARRNQYRSARAHFAPQVKGREPGRLEGGLFDLKGWARGECLHWSKKGFLGRHGGYGALLWLSVRVEDERIIVSAGWEGLRPAGPRLCLGGPPIPVSPGYGRLLSSRMSRPGEPEGADFGRGGQDLASRS